MQAMKASRRRVGLAVTVLTLLVAAPALAQENIDAGKTPAQLYAQNCAICHKTPHGLSKAGGILGLQNYLREHYTASRQSAAAIAAYLISIDRKSPPRERARHTRRVHDKAKADKDTKLPPEKPAQTKAKAEAKSESKPDTKAQTKPAEADAAPRHDSKPKPAEAKAAPKHDGKPKPVEAKAEPKTNGVKPPDAKPEKKAD